MAATPKSDVLAEAFDWLARVDGGAMSDAERASFDAWLEQGEEHRAALALARETPATLSTSKTLEALYLETLEELDEESEEVGGGSYAPAWLAPILSRSGIAAVAAFGLALVVTSTVILLRTPAGVSYETEIAQSRAIELPDGSRVDLAPESRIRVAYSESLRHVDLLKGEAFFEVHKGDAREFLVASDGAEVRVVGTRFNVHNGPRGVTVAVEEGVVRVRQEQRRRIPTARTDAQGSKEIDDAGTELTAGETTLASAETGVSRPVDIDPDRAGAWRSGRLVYRNNSLLEVVSDVNRYTATRIEIADPSLYDLRVMAAFSTKDINGMLDGLEGLLPVTIDRTSPDKVVIRARADE